MRKLINNPADVVREMLEGMTDLNPQLRILDNENIIIRSELNTSAEVAVISGGGSGHEPAQAGYVGKGMLHASIAGDVFTSPSVDSVLVAIRLCSGEKGALLMVTNYTGDRLNFGLAAEMARTEGIAVEIVIIGDDVALRDTVAAEQSRGIAGTILVNKVAGAAAASGADLEFVRQEAQDAADNVATMGVALGACIIPAAGKPGFELPDGEIELGLGVHGEKGMERVAHKSADELVEIILEKIIRYLGVQANEKVALLINGLGGTPIMELTIVARHAIAVLRKQGIIVCRAWSGNFMTSLEMPGFSLSIMRLNESRLARLDYPVNLLSWIGDGKIPGQRNVLHVSAPPIEPSEECTTPDRSLQRMGLRIAEALEQAEPVLTALDSAAGDGDLGLSMCRGAAAIRSLPDYAWCNEVIMLRSLGNALRKAIAGSSGPFYATALLRASRYLAQQTDINPMALAEAFILATEAVTELGGARPNDRTMVDALYPAAHAFHNAVSKGELAGQALAKAISAAEDGVTKTATMLPRLGRASYLGARVYGVEDAGAKAVLVWLKAIQDNTRVCP